MNAIERLCELGQSPWLDDMRRGLITGGGLKFMIDDDGIQGLTSNPAIFEAAIARSGDYDGAIRRLARKGKSVQEIYQILTIEDVQQAADLFRPLYEESGGQNGYVSYEVSPRLAYDTAGTLQEARHLWQVIDCPNVMIKVPATHEGIPAIKALIQEGINVNVTLIFSLTQYEDVANAYIEGLEARLAAHKDVTRIASVASFFLSRIDVLLDPQLEVLQMKGGEKGEKAARIVGEVAIANAKLAYKRYQELFLGERFAKLKDAGARPQRLLWASTGTKNPNYKVDKYVAPLIGEDTINTMTQDTINKYRKVGDPHQSITEDVAEAQQIINTLSELGIDLDSELQYLKAQGIAKFVTPFNSLMDTLAQARAEALELHPVV